MSEASAKFDSDKSLSSYEEFSLAVLDRKGTGKGERLRELISKAFIECRMNNVGITTDMIVAVGRKGPRMSQIS